MKTFCANGQAEPMPLQPAEPEQTIEEIQAKAIEDAIYWIKEEASPWDALRALEKAQQLTQRRR